MSTMSIENNAIFAIFYSKSDVFTWKKIHIVAASSHALSLKDFNVEEKREYSGHIAAIPGLALNPD